MPDVTPEEIAEQFIAVAIDRAPEPLQRLGRLLTEILDADDFNAVEPLLLGLAKEIEGYREDLRLAAGELAIPVPTPGTDMARLLSANVLMRREIERLDREYAATSDDLIAAQARLATAEGMAKALDSIPCPECAEGSTFHGGYAGASANCPYCGGTGEHPLARAALDAWQEAADAP